MEPVLLYQLCLTFIPHIGPVQARILLQHFEVQEIFRAPKRDLERIEGIGSIRATAIRSFKGFSEAEQEIAFMEKYQVSPLFITDPAYPRRLLNCYDPPTLLFYKGTADLNKGRVIAVIGTRSQSEYGRLITGQFVEGLAQHQVTIVSGLAFGIDATAHRSAIRNNLPTVGVLAHGLDQLYPAEHSSLAREMLRSGGGLLTEFRSKCKPDRHNFPTRNRIVAGMCDAVIVIETGSKGGSMITAELADSYNKDVFAFPGRSTDTRSEGCNQLIRNNKAGLITSAAQLVEAMNWDHRPKPREIQKELFIELSAEEQCILGILRDNLPIHIDEINFRSGLSSSTVAAAILNLELRNVVLSLPGKVFQIA